jgi:glucose/arabinose dehydrogenase
MHTDKGRLKTPVLSPRICVNLRLNLLVIGLVLSAFAQSQFTGNTPQPKPAFLGQTKAPPPAKASPAINVETITARLNSPWSLAFLPDGNFLLTESSGFMRVVRPDGVVYAPITGVPGVKVVAAQGLHDVLLDPDFARNRKLYFTYFAPPPGEGPSGRTSFSMR